MKHTMKTTCYALVCVTALLTLLAACQKDIVAPALTSEPHAVESEKVEKNTKNIAIDSISEKEKDMDFERTNPLREDVQMLESEMLYFNFDSADLKPEAQTLLKKKAAWLLDNPAYTLLIEGHCDERGTGEYNIALGKRRADSARKYLEAMGVPVSQVKSLSYGKERPADPESHDKAWAKNRRDEFKLIMEKALSPP